MFNYILGIGLFAFSIILYYVSGSQKIETALIGLIGLTLLWIIGIQRDLYDLSVNRQDKSVNRQSQKEDSK